MKKYLEGQIGFIKQFLNDDCELAPGAGIKASELLSAYDRWVQRQWDSLPKGRGGPWRTLTPISFGRAMKAAGVPFRVLNGYTLFLGYKPRASSVAPIHPPE